VDGELGCGNPFRRNIDGIENAIDEADEQTENMRQTQEALATPVGASADFDEVPILSY
jgi:charged multivesicular body protein 4